MSHSIHKPSSLLSRRKTSFLLSHQTTDFSTNPYPIDASNIEDPSRMRVKIPKKSYTGLGYLLYKLRYLIWQDVVPHNTLNQSFFISGDNLTVLRQITMSLYATCFTWQIMKLNADESALETSWLSFWGLLLGATYFLLTLIAQDEPDTSFLWKLTYIIGEISIAIEFLILPLNLPSLISQLSAEEVLNGDEVAYKMCITVLCPLFALAEIFCDYIAFPKCHRTSLSVLAVVYLVSEILWIAIRNQSLLEAMNWNEVHNCLLKGAVVCVLLLEFMLGNKFYDWKLLRSEKSASRSPKKLA